MLLFETILLCVFFFAVCYSGTGSDEKNLRSYASYPDPVQKLVRNNPEWSAKIRETSAAATFVSNFLMFGVLLFICGLVIREKSFSANFVHLSVIGQTLNLFDLLVIDLLWWRHSGRVRFTGTEDQPELYRDPKKHVASFVRGAVLFVIVAAADGFVLTLF